MGVEVDKENIEELQERFKSALIKKICVRCGSKQTAYIYIGRVFEMLENPGRDLEGVILHNGFYLCENCAREFAELLKKFLNIHDDEVDGDG